MNTTKYGTIKQNKSNYLFQTLQGEYIIVPAISKKGDIGLFSLEIHLDDKLISEGNNTASTLKLENTIIERFNITNLPCKNEYF